MKIQYKEVRFKQESLDRIDQCNSIIDEYQAEGLRLTLRQLYYQLVSRDIVPNVERSYKNLSTLVSDARLAGVMDWDAIEDRVRQPRVPLQFENLTERMELALANYRLPRWRGQEYYTELWVEKDALAGVLQPIATEFHVTLMVNRGYSSQSAMYESAERFIENTNGLTEGQEEKKPILFYLGDLDPSGEDMVRDIQARLALFGVQDLEVMKLALTMDQVRAYKPPPNPAKVTDPRAGAYIAKYGDKSWEVDALPPNVLARLIRGAFRKIVDKDAMDAVIAQEERDTERLREALSSLE